jgi:uncharacterized membrane protein YgcG
MLVKMLDLLCAVTATIPVTNVHDCSQLRSPPFTKQENKCSLQYMCVENAHYFDVLGVLAPLFNAPDLLVTRLNPARTGGAGAGGGAGGGADGHGGRGGDGGGGGMWGEAGVRRRVMRDGVLIND